LNSRTKTLVSIELFYCLVGLFCLRLRMRTLAPGICLFAFKLLLPNRPFLLLRDRLPSQRWFPYGTKSCAAAFSCESAPSLGLPLTPKKPLILGLFVDFQLNHTYGSCPCHHACHGVTEHCH